MKKVTEKGILLMVCSSVCTCTGQLMWKLQNTAENGILFLLLGFLLYGLGAVIMILAFQYGEVSVLQPMLSIGFALSVVLGHFVLGEAITGKKIAGIVLIIIGMILLGKSNTERRES